MTAETQAPPVTELGRARPRKEDARLVTGRTNWTDNLILPGMLHVAYVRSPFAHARITRVDVSRALQSPGVFAAFSGADFADEQGSLPCAWPVTPDIVIPAHPPMATDEVRYVGEAVACVVARDRYAAADALEAIDVDYEPLPPVLDIRTALDESSPKVHEAGNKSFEWVFGNGDIDAAFSGAEVVLERNYRQQRLIPSAMEPRAVVGWNEGEEYTLWSSTQIPHVLRVMLALVTGIPEHQLRVIAPDVGGGFGSKLQVTAEEVLALLISRKVGRPVKWTESRSEGNLTVHHGRDQWQRIRVAADRDGRLRGLSVDLLADMGAYLMLVTPGVPLLGAFMFNSIYKMDALSFRCTGVFTTKMPTDAYRGAGRPEATFGIERIMDDLAFELGIEPLELRERNWIKHEEFPYTTIAGLTYDSGNYEAATAKAKELFRYDELRVEQEQRRDSHDPVQLGIGISTYTEMCGLAPSRVLGSLAYGAGGWEHASIRMLPTGKVEVVTGASAHGQGHETAWSQIVADKLGVPFEDVRVLHGDTQVSPKGMDTYGSRSLTVGGVAVHGACEKVIVKAKVIASAMLEAPPEEIEFEAGKFSVRGNDAVVKTIQEIALATFAAHDLPDGVEPNIDSDATFTVSNALANRIFQLVENAEIRITAARSKRNGAPVGYGDVALVMRGFTDLSAYEDALASQGVPFVVGSGGRGYIASYEIQDLLSVLTLLVSPLDDAALLTALRSPFVGVEVDTLCRLALHARTADTASSTQRVPLFSALKSLLTSDVLPVSEREKIEPFVVMLHTLQPERDRIATAQLIERLIHLTDYDLRLACRPDGRRQLANVHKLIEMALTWSTIGLREFIDQIRDIQNINDYEADTARAEDGAENAVRILTIHAAKGLEFPVVVIPDLSRPLLRPETSLFVCDPGTRAIGSKLAEGPDAVYRAVVAARSIAASEESLRLLYVAMTRAGEHLILAGNAGRNRGYNWTDLILPVLRISEAPTAAYHHRLNSDAEMYVAPLSEYYCTASDNQYTDANRLRELLVNALIAGEVIEPVIAAFKSECS